MNDGRILHDDVRGAVIDYPAGGVLEIRWYDGTADLDRVGFNDWLSTFADLVEATRRPRLLVDATSFRMPPSQMDGDWRDAHIIPRYNAAGVRRFAFLMPEGMPAIGSDPAPEGPADFATGYFGTREEALAWLRSAPSDGGTDPRPG